MKSVTILSTVAFMSAATPLLGQSGTAHPSDAGSSASTPDSGISEVNEVVVTAQRRAERLEDVPFSVTVQSGAQLAAVGITDTRGLENVTPGLSMQMQAGFLQPSLRGVSTNVVAPGADNPIAIYLDGVYVSSQAGAIISLPDIERVEVLKGPQGTLFGRNATGGAIQIFTVAPSFVPTGSISAIAGAYDGAGSSRFAYDLGVQGYVSGPLVSERLAGSISFMLRGTNGYGENVVYGRVSPAVDRALGSDRADKDHDRLVRGKLLFTPLENLQILATGYLSRRDTDQNNATYATLNTSVAENFPDHLTATQPWQSAFDAPRPNQIVDEKGTSLKIDLDTGLGHLSSTSAFSSVNDIQDTDVDSSYSPLCLQAFACVGDFTLFRDRDFSQELLFTSRRFGAFSFVTGAFGYSSNGRVNVRISDFAAGALPLAPQVVNPSLYTFDETIKSQALGAFAEGTYQLTERLSAIAGLRYSYESKQGYLSLLGGPSSVVAKPHWDKLTPRISVRYALTASSNVYATYSVGFKSGVIPIGDPTARAANPENLDAYEIGFKTAQKSFSLNVAAFYYDYKDLQVQSNLGNGGQILVVNNAASARIIGLDVDTTADVTQHLSVRSGISWLPQAEFTSYKGAVGDPPVAIGGFPAGPSVIDLSHTRLFKTPRVTLTTGATYRTPIPSGTLSFSPNLYYASRLYIEPTHLIHIDNLRVGAEMAYEPSGSGLRFAVWGKNLTNEDSFVTNSLSGSQWGLIAQPPREFGVTATYNF
ncbi:MAG TPA: TonB-dependent receptor [Steroidobacteraceae bacterium]|nr:TonB-dependent receptor [Steroidobacteraceae bacterium]